MLKTTFGLSLALLLLLASTGRASGGETIEISGHVKSFEKESVVLELESGSLCKVSKNLLRTSLPLKAGSYLSAIIPRKIDLICTKGNISKKK